MRRTNMSEARKVWKEPYYLLTYVIPAAGAGGAGAVMNERGGAYRGAGAPFYAPPRRKTSAEIISEARAAIYGEMIGGDSNASDPAGNSALRPLRTRRPFTPRDPQRTLFGDRTRRREARPPSSFSLKYLSLAESSEDGTDSGAEALAGGFMVAESQTKARKKSDLIRGKSQQQDSGWAGTRLPHLSGHSKPLHRRNIDHSFSEELSTTMKSLGSVDQDTATASGPVDEMFIKSVAADRRKQYAGTKAVSYDSERGAAGRAGERASRLGDVTVKHLAVQLPHAAVADGIESMTTLEIAEELLSRNSEPERVQSLLEALQGLLEKATPTTRLREMVTRALYAHVDSENEAVLAAIARAMLTMRVTGSHLSAACKLVFKVARNDKNDHLFKDTNLLDLLVEGCGRACPLTEGECCVYGAGALRFLTLEPKLRARAQRAGALHLAALHLKIINNAKRDKGTVSEESIHALYQVTGALRNLLGGGGCGGTGASCDAQAVLASGALPELIAALPLYVTDRDVLTNVVRCLSVVSADSLCCAWLCAAEESTSALLAALAGCAARAPLAVRLAYTLGNMAAADEKARINIYNSEGGVDVLLTVLESYTERSARENPETLTDPDIHLVDSDLGGSDGSSEDVLIKVLKMTLLQTVRVIANMCLAESAGRGLAAAHAHRTVRALLACLALAERPACSDDRAQKALPDRKERVDGGNEVARVRERREELATAALATLSNVTFYREPPEPPDDPLDQLVDELSQVTGRWVCGSGPAPAACEAVRALGNVSRWPRAAHALFANGALHALEPYLQHEEPDVRCSAAGVLVNVCGAGVGGAGVDSAAAVAAHALEAAAAHGDAPTAALLARALWNALAHAPLPQGRAQQAAAALAYFLDDESVFAACEAPPAAAGRHGGVRGGAGEPRSDNHRVKFEDEASPTYADGNFSSSCSGGRGTDLVKLPDGDVEGNGEDLGFEDGDLMGEDGYLLGVDGCECIPCRRLAAWEELVGVAIPLMDKLIPQRADASVGTD